MLKTKSDLINAVAAKTGSTKAAAKDSVDATIEAIKEFLEKEDDSFSLVGFGSFKVVKTKARSGVNPRTGEKIKIQSRKKIKFTLGKELKEKLNG